MRLKVKTFTVHAPACWGRALEPQSFCRGRSRELVVFSCCLISFAFHFPGDSVPVKGLLQDTLNSVVDFGNHRLPVTSVGSVPILD